jgi:hypothetical protein
MDEERRTYEPLKTETKVGILTSESNQELT